MRLWRSQRAHPPGAGQPPAGSADARGYVAVRSHAEVAQLAQLVLDPDRQDVVVVLTSRARELVPSLDVQDVRTIVGPSALIHFVATGPLTIDLSDRLPDRRAPYNGSLRIWLPGYSAASDRLAFVCAMIACDRVADLASLAQNPLPPASNGVRQEVSGADGVSAWQCSLTHLDSQTPPAVRYLKRTDGTVEFTGTGAHKPSSRIAR